jgi:hypothetical protein
VPRIFAVALVACLANVTFADAVVTNPQTIHVGIYVNQINSLSLKANQFEVDFTIWFRGQTDDFDPIETFDVMDGQNEYVSTKTRLKVGDKNYASCRVVAKITKFWNVSRFPRDDHTLIIAIEDGSNEESKVRYIADQGCGLSPRIRVPGWEVAAGTATVTTESYNTNYGDTSLRPNESAYSRLDFSIKIVRPGWGYFWKLFSGLFVATGIALLAFGIKPGDGRFGLGAGAIFAAVASQYITASNLPDTNILTMADLLHIVAFVFIFLSMAQSTIALHLANVGKMSIARWFDFASVFGLGGAYVGLSVWVVARWGD